MPREYFFAKEFARKNAKTLNQFSYEDQDEMSQNLAKIVKSEQKHMNKSRKRPRRLPGLRGKSPLRS